MKAFFISGVCGVGKSAIIPYLKKLLPSEKYDVRDFDERGVPDGADHSWRKAEVKKWLEVAKESAGRGVVTVICGFVKSKDFEDLVSGDLEAEILLLDADSETIRKRLVGRYSKNGVFDETQKVIGRSVNDFIESNVYYCNVMRKECTEEGCRIINTSACTPEEVAQKVVALNLEVKYQFGS